MISEVVLEWISVEVAEGAGSGGAKTGQEAGKCESHRWDRLCIRAAPHCEESPTEPESNTSLPWSTPNSGSQVRVCTVAGNGEFAKPLEKVSWEGKHGPEVGGRSPQAWSRQMNSLA